MGRFAGKTIVVTGSGRKQGLGQAILQRFADEGANCVVSDLGTPAETWARATSAPPPKWKRLPKSCAVAAPASR